MLSTDAVSGGEKRNPLFVKLNARKVLLGSGFAYLDEMPRCHVQSLLD